MSLSRKFSSFPGWDVFPGTLFLQITFSVAVTRGALLAGTVGHQLLNRATDEKQVLLQQFVWSRPGTNAVVLIEHTIIYGNF